MLFAQNGGQFTDIPFVTTAANVVNAMVDVADIKAGDVLIDLGSGDGRIVMAACKRFGIQATGVEIDPDLVRRSQTLANQNGLGGKATFVQADPSIRHARSSGQQRDLRLVWIDCRHLASA